MKHAATFLLTFALGTAVCLSAFAQAHKQDPVAAQSLQSEYGPNYEEILAKYGDDPVRLQQFSDAYRASSQTKPFMFKGAQGSNYVVRSEVEPNDYFDTADNIDDVLMAPGWRGDGEFTGGLIAASFTEGDFDVYSFEVDTTKMYYFAGTHSFPGTVNHDNDDPDVSMRLFHESDMDTMFVEDFHGIEGNNQIQGDILGETTDHRANSGDFRLTGWVSPVDPLTNSQLTGRFYLFIYNGEGGSSPRSINSLGNTGTYHMGAYAIDMDPWVDKYEPNENFTEALTNPMSMLPADGVVRTFMGFNPDTVKIVKPSDSRSEIRPTQSNIAYPQLLAQGDEDVDHYRIDGLEAGHTLVIETLPYFGWYRDPDGSMGPGNTRWTDTRCRLYNADYTTILLEDDDAGREVQSTTGQPNNIHCRITYTVQEADVGAPLWLWVSAWASATRSEGQSVDNRDPGRFMYKVYVHQYSTDPNEVEPNNTVAEAMSVAPRADAALSGSFSDGSDGDHYRVFLHRQRMYTFFSQNTTVSDDIQVELYREDESDNMGGTAVSGNLLANPVAGNAGGHNFMISGFVPPESGAYILSLSSASAGSYELGILDKGEVFDGVIANEPDNTVGDALAQDALPVGPGAAARVAAIYPAGDVDNYHFTVDAGFDLMIALTASQDLANDIDATLELTLPDGTTMTSSEGLISFRTTEGGQYIVTVAGATDESVGFYKLAGGVPFEETEDNNSFANANPIALGNTYEASLTQGDVDYYRFTLEGGKLYSFRSLDNETGAALSVELFDDVNGTTLLDDSGWPDNYKRQQFQGRQHHPARDQDLLPEDLG